MTCFLEVETVWKTCLVLPCLVDGCSVSLQVWNVRIWREIMCIKGRLWFLRSYCFHGMICYKHSQHYVAFFWCAARKRWTFFDDRIVEEKDDWVSVANFLLAEGSLVCAVLCFRGNREHARSWKLLLLFLLTSNGRLLYINQSWWKIWQPRYPDFY